MSGGLQIDFCSPPFLVIIARKQKSGGIITEAGVRRIEAWEQRRKT
jgi:hypothetical protein